MTLLFTQSNLLNFNLINFRKKKQINQSYSQKVNQKIIQKTNKSTPKYDYLNLKRVVNKQIEK